MDLCFRLSRALCTLLSRVLITGVLLVSAAAFAQQSIQEESGEQLPPESETTNVEMLVARMDTVDSDVSPVIMVNNTVETGMGGAGQDTRSYWLLVFLLALNLAGVVHMRRWAATIEGREDKE